ncbi:MAG: serine hydroxymethyltransferase [Candidatus Latescibacterota bacterium]
MERLKQTDAEVYEILQGEEKRQRDKLQMIPSENYVSRAVREAVASTITNKYAEGYPGKRYYEGCEYADQIESLAQARAKQLFGADHANVQPHAGSQANMAAYLGLLDPGDTILGMTLSHGGHLTHGHEVNFSARWFRPFSYGVDRKTERIDYEALRKLALETRPKLIVAGATAYPRILDFARFREIADEVGALLMVDMAHIAGLIAAGVHPTPIPYADVVTSSTHKTLRGPRGGLCLCRKRFAADIDRGVFPGTQGGPLVQIMAGKAVAFKEDLEPAFKAYSAQIVSNAQALSDALLSAGFRLVSGGTDTHLLIMDLTETGITGKRAAKALDRAGITTNKNTIPFDRRNPALTSGVRLGTPALTTRGMKEGEMRVIAGMIQRVLGHIEQNAVLESVRIQVKELCDQFSVPD